MVKRDSWKIAITTMQRPNPQTEMQNAWETLPLLN